MYKVNGSADVNKPDRGEQNNTQKNTVVVSFSHEYQKSLFTYTGIIRIASSNFKSFPLKCNSKIATLNRHVFQCFEPTLPPTPQLSVHGLWIPISMKAVVFILLAILCGSFYECYYMNYKNMNVLALPENYLTFLSLHD